MRRGTSRLVMAVLFFVAMLPPAHAETEASVLAAVTGAFSFSTCRLNDYQDLCEDPHFTLRSLPVIFNPDFHDLCWADISQGRSFDGPCSIHNGSENPVDRAATLSLGHLNGCNDWTIDVHDVFADDGVWFASYPAAKVQIHGSNYRPSLGLFEWTLYQWDVTVDVWIDFLSISPAPPFPTELKFQGSAYATVPCSGRDVSVGQSVQSLWFVTSEVQ